MKEKEQVPEDEIKIAEFKEAAQRIIEEMNRERGVFGAGFPSTGGGPSHEKRETSKARWGELYIELQQTSAQLFKEVGGQKAYDILEETVNDANTKWGSGPSHKLDNEPEFIAGILIRATEKDIEN